MSDSPNTSRFVSYYEKQGFSFFPLPHGQKKDDTFKWGTYQKRKPTKPELEGWFNNGTKHNVAVICGKVSSNLVILDCDTEERFYELAVVMCAKLGVNDILDITKVSKTGKGYHIWLTTDEPTQSAKFPKLDIKGEGGYIVAPPSLHPDGNYYEFLNPKVKVRHIKNLLDIGIDINQRKEAQPVTQHETWVTEALKGIGEGGRNDICYRLAAYFKNKHPQDITERLLLDWNSKNSPPLVEREVLQTIKSAYNRVPLESPTDEYNTFINNYSPHSAVLATERYKSVTESVTERALKTLKMAERGENVKRFVTESVTEGVTLGNSETTATGLATERYKSVTESVTERYTLLGWIKESGGSWFSYDDLDKEFNIKSEAEKLNRRVIIKRLKDAGIVEAHPKQNKLYRYVNVAVRLIDFKAALGKTTLDIKYPFGIEKYFKTYPGNIIVVAGAPDAGKTAFLLNFIRLNQFDFSIFYQSSEMGQDELSNRLLKFEGITLDDWNFIAEERSSDFADVVRPDCVNIIDYLELCGDFYMVAEYLKQIHDKLASGIAIVAIQKNPGSDQGRGGTFGLEKPRLYLNIDAGKIVIRKAKNWTNPTVNPNRLQMNFKIVGGCRFFPEGDWFKPDA